MGINSNMFAFIRSFPSNRSFQVRAGSSQSLCRTSTNGIPQGIVLSPHFILHSTYDLPDMGVGRTFSRRGKVDTSHPFQVADDATQIDVHKTFYPFQTIKKMSFVTTTVTKIALRW